MKELMLKVSCLFFWLAFACSRPRNCYIREVVETRGFTLLVFTKVTGKKRITNNKGKY